MAHGLVESLAEDYDVSIDYAFLRKWWHWRNPLKQARHLWAKLRYAPDLRGQVFDGLVFLQYNLDRAGGYLKPGLEFSWKALVKGRYIDGFPPPGHEDWTGSEAEYLKEYFGDADVVVCGSDAIRARCAKWRKGVFYAGGWTNRSQVRLFHPAPDGLRRVSAQMVVGWTGNPRALHKGLQDVIIPAVQKAKLLRPGIEFRTRYKGSMAGLAKFYKDIDVVTIASSADAGPSMFGEAALSGIPAISTAIGHPLEVIRSGVNGVIIERDIESMARALVRLYDHPEEHRAMGGRIREDFLAKCGPEVCKKQWQAALRYALTTAAQRQNPVGVVV